MICSVYVFVFVCVCVKRASVCVSKAHSGRTVADGTMVGGGHLGLSLK